MERTQVVYHIGHIDIRYKQKTTLFKMSWQTLPYIMELLYTERSQTIQRQRYDTYDVIIYQIYTYQTLATERDRVNRPDQRR